MARQVADKPSDIQLKFDGEPVRRLDGAPAEAVVASLIALQRMVHIIGMGSEGRLLSERLKPSEKVKREYAVICHAPEHGSHVQPFSVASQNGEFTSSSLAARSKLLDSLKSFSSGNEEAVQRVLPNPRERWFMARAALGLLPSEDSGLEITIRPGAHGPFSFSATRARALLITYQKIKPPEVEEWTFVGKLRAIDFSKTILTMKSSDAPALRLDYPMVLEDWLKANVRKRLRISGRPRINQKGNVGSFQQVYFATEIEPSIEAVTEFQANSQTMRSSRPLSIAVTVDWPNRLFTFQDQALGIDVFSQDYNTLRHEILAELDVLWRHYALAPDDELDNEAHAVKRALLARFKAVGGSQ